ncbi:DUF4153 domain-containing protein [Neobacillus sp. OS1-2]|uniref:DUF4153 domain-containing protein n=1 Tax=Neobacillus sp. OS1-2 TaxID=3070680 RepID=UPI0027E12C5C|nr:DUF4153 domain-containing protein [Neobacillus sp. OS1-2]WML39467.1 DUF4153 domain-containing protein [Neobacillus sp. OS1-2]
MKMKWMRSLQAKLTGLTDAIVRFPLTTLFLVGAAAINASTINAGTHQSILLVTFVVGAFLSAVFQVDIERFSSKASIRFLLMILVILLTAGYYLIVRPAPTLSMEIEIRTGVALFALLIAFIWIPVIKSEISFNQSFMIAFKSFFNTLFFSGVIFGGLAIILSAIHQLIFNINSAAYSHTANIVFILFAPMYFLSLIPTYPRKNKRKEYIEKAASCPKFLDILLSYILIPLLSVFTLILLIYIIKNIGGEFWKDNLLEPMLVSYAITVILMYILVSEIENKFTAFFRLIFPKVLVPIVLFQITSSILSVVDTGVTHTRYYVILFGIFAAAAGILLSFLPVRKNGVIAVMLIIFSVISIVPPVDAFTISRSSQIDTLKNVLLKNKMLENNTIRPDDTIPAKDKQIITDTISYLEMMGYTKKIEWLPDDFNAYHDFLDTFGFKEYQNAGQVNPSIYLNLAQETPITITGYDTFATIEINMAEKNREGKIFDIKKQGKTYSLLKDMQQDQWVLTLEGANNQALITFHTQKIFDKFYDYQPTAGQLSAEEATFTEENDRAKITIVVQNVGIEKQYKRNTNATLLVFVQVK